jgi:hypothetical protein
VPLSVLGPKANFKVCKEPFGLSLSKPLSSPFGLSLSKPSCHTQRAPFDRLRAIGNTGSAWPFDKLRANGGGEHVNAKGGGEPTFVNGRNGPKAAV